MSLAVPPTFLYMRGTLLERDRNAVAIVGSRHCSAYGMRVAQRLAFELARAGFTIVSGLARGIDGAAHRGALSAGGRTIAVLAGGLAKIYPPEHAELADQVQAQGALLTEAPMLMEPLAGMFPSRNRIISGLSRGVILVEAADKSGALITAMHAAEQGREVFAVPGPVDSVTSAGTLRLLRQGARLIRNAADVIEDLDGIAPIVSEAPAPATPEDLDETQMKIWNYLQERRSVDQIAREFSLGIAELSRILMALEIKGVIRRLPGNVYERHR
jgi:DNA processing protein